MTRLLRRIVPSALALVIAVALFLIADSRVATADAEDVAADYRLEELDIAMPPGYAALPTSNVRSVNPAYEHIKSWISSVGGAIAVNDIVGSGRANGICLVDTRTDKVVVTYAPTAPATDRFTPFLLEAGAGLTDTMAPMGCVPGDFNADGSTDFAVYYWGRTPVIFVAQPGATAPAAESYLPTEPLPATIGGQYNGERWNTNALTVADLDADGHPDLLVGNYFPDSGVLDPASLEDVEMNDSMSSARNAGGLRVLRWVSNDADGTPRYVEDKQAFPSENASGWTLAMGAADLTGDHLPEVYVANDFGPDHLFHNTSTQGRVRFSTATGTRGPTTPKSFALGHDSFKGMGVDFLDLDRTGRLDMVVSNITSAWGLEESNFVWRNDATSPEAMATSLRAGEAPFTQKAQDYGLAWNAWAWDVKGVDLRNSGAVDILQTSGFVQGEAGKDRWNWLQELAMSNDNLLRNPAMWPKVGPGDDLSGHQPLALFARGSGTGTDGKYVDISPEVGILDTTPTRGVAPADTTGTGVMDFAVARQFGPPAFYRNVSPDLGSVLELELYRPATGATGATGTADPTGSLSGPGTPAYGAAVTVRTADGKRQTAQLDGGSGHGGKRSFQVHFGLGEADEPVEVTLDWLSVDGTSHTEVRTLEPGVHRFLLTDDAEEISR